MSVSKIMRALIFSTSFYYAEVSVGQELKPSELRGKNAKQQVDVLQNRHFVKARRPEIGLLVGTFINEAYTNTTFYGLRGGLFINEWFGAEVGWIKTSVKDSADRKALNQKKYRDLDEDKVVTPDTETNPIYSAIDVNGVAAPFYGKLNLFDQFIVYTDLYVSLGASKVETEQGDLTGIILGAGQRLYMMEALSVRLDFRDRSYVEKRAGSNSRKNALSFDIGVSYFFF